MLVTTIPLLVTTIPLLSTTLLLQQAPDFARDVQPILVKNCFGCHGPDAGSRKGKLRLDTRAGATASVIVPGDAAASELIQRITAAGKKRMPPAKSGKDALTPEQTEVLRKWIDGGARWGRHWSFVAPVRPQVPPTESNWARNPIDRFVLRRLRAAGLEPSPAADKRTLVRRVSFDLTGLPPSRTDVDRFLADSSPQAYEKLVDRLLASPRYGERMAMVWLDAARYSDTDGFQIDETRSNWPWRDWVVDAYNANKPFDEFTVEQFAGDLLPNATPEQILATCFHRNHMTNGEGGRDAEESRVDYVIDRVNTVGTVWMGLTLGCAQCHDHKYDPISQRDYYSLNAFFDSIAEDGRAGRGAKPFLKFRSPHTDDGLAAAEAWLARQSAALRRTEEEAQRGFDAWLRRVADGAADGHRSWHPIRPLAMRTTHGSRIAWDAGSFRVTGKNPRHDDYVLTTRPDLPRLTGMKLSVLPHASHTGGGLSLADDGHVILTNLKISVRRKGLRQVREIAVRSATADFQKKKRGDKAYGPVRDVLDDDPRTGWSTLGSDPRETRTAVFAFAEPLRLAADEELTIELRHRSLKGYASIRHFRVELTDELGPAIRRVGRTPREAVAERKGRITELTKSERDALLAEFLAGQKTVIAARQVRDQARRRRDSYRRAAKPVNVMVLAQRKRTRTTHILERGVWDKLGDKVTARSPATIGTWPKDVEPDRQGLARYLVDPRHPLTARVAVNRHWQMYFGAGLVRTPEDFGLQGERPTHPELLDWLATEFIRSGWDVKHVQKLIVMSATYRQSSKAAPTLRKRDPENRLLARASRFRLPSWMIRDAALAASGLLTPRRGGPPVFPYQPDGVWADSTMGRFRYARSVGDDLHRRSIYGFWRRLVAPTGMFDASKRRVCQVRVVRTNSPLQALTLMNDTTYVEAARVLAERTLSEVEGDDARITRIFECVLSRLPTKSESKRLRRQIVGSRGEYAAHRDAARSLASQGASPAAPKLDPVDVAVFTIVASTVLNLDEAITRE